MTKPKDAKAVLTFINPAGFVEQHYRGDQTKKTVSHGVASIHRLANKVKSGGKEPLLLVDISEVTSTDIGSHMAAVKGMKNVPYKKLAIYGPLQLQVLLNTLAIVADKHDQARAFNNRADALRWLRQD